MIVSGDARVLLGEHAAADQHDRRRRPAARGRARRRTRPSRPCRRRAAARRRRAPASRSGRGGSRRRSRPGRSRSTCRARRRSGARSRCSRRRAAGASARGGSSTTAPARARPPPDRCRTARARRARCRSAPRRSATTDSEAPPALFAMWRVRCVYGGRRRAEALDLPLGVGGVGVGGREVAHQPDDLDRRRGQLREPPAAHAGVELQVHAHAGGHARRRETTSSSRASRACPTSRLPAGPMTTMRAVGNSRRSSSPSGHGRDAERRSRRRRAPLRRRRRRRARSRSP